MSLSENILALRDLLEKGFCQNALATDKENKDVWYTDKSAANFCIVGGLYHLFEGAGDNVYLPLHAYLSDKAKQAGFYNLPNLNNSNSKAFVIGFLNNAAAEAKDITLESIQ